MNYYPNHVTRDLVQHTRELAQYGVLFRNSKSHGSRIISLEYIPEQDSSDGAMLHVEVTESDKPPDCDEGFSVPLLAESDSNRAEG